MAARRCWARGGGGVAATHAALLLALWPAGSAPFSAPKLALLAGCGAAALLTSLWRPQARMQERGPVPLLSLLWLALLLCSALSAQAADPASIARDAGAALLCFGLASSAGHLRGPARALGLLGALEALLVLLQVAGLDPLSALAPHAPGRLRGYGTLGNPDFAAAWLGASLWLSLAEAWAARARGPRLRWLAAVLVQVAALAALRSFGSLLGLGAGALFAWFALREPSRAQPRRPISDAARPSRAPSRALLAAACLAALALCAGLARRSPGRALDGRLHLWSTGAAALPGVPLFGYGPGSVALLQPAWEAERFASGAAGPQQRPFAGAQDHLHQDLLERALEQGPLGAAVFALLLAAGLWSAWSGARALGLSSSAQAPFARARLAAAGAALASLAARGLVDFPAARPAELALLVTLVALAARAAAAVAPAPATRPPIPDSAAATNATWEASP